MRLSEIFHSIQGEGLHAGTPTVFVRTTGCNLRCWFCDTAYTSWQPEGDHTSLESILATVEEYACEHVVVTGGEPLLQPDVVPLTQSLQAAGHYVTIETAGTVFRPVSADLMSISPKLSNSTPNSGRWAQRHEQTRNNRDVIRQMVSGFAHQLKFVIDCPDDLAEVDAYLAEWPEIQPDCVWLMPQAITAEDVHQKTDWLIPAAEQRGFHVSPRLHVELFGNVRGK